MVRVRRGANAPSLSSSCASCRRSGRGPADRRSGGRAASVAWPVSTLVVSEVQTGGGSASDEFVEVANQGAGPST